MLRMKPLQSSLEHKVESFDDVRSRLAAFQFTLGGNWEYDRGYFDRALDEANKVWLRIPFQVTNGAIDAEAEETGATVELGRPFVLKHVYNEGLDDTADAETAGALVDQFQTPLDPDAEIEQKWVADAANLLQQVEAGWAQQ
jgi:hypothetical protein